MAINISVHGSPVSIRRGKMLITDIEHLKKNEVNRRRRLRLEQVRQQSKDIANRIRERVCGEREKQCSSFEQQQSAELKRLQARKLLLLQQKYQDCLDDVGMGHMQAALQEDAADVLKAEHKRNRTQAEERGREATVRLKLELADTEKNKNALVKQQKFSRTIEDLRAAVVASLGKKLPNKKRQKKKSLPSVVEGSTSHRLPNCTCGCAECICTPVETSKGVSVRVERIPAIPLPSSSDTQRDTGRRTSDVSSSSYTSDSSSESDSTPVAVFESRSTTSTAATSSSTDVAQSRVKLYDHSNRFVSDYPRQARVERVFPLTSEPNAREAADAETLTSSSGKLLMEEVTCSRLRARSSQAMVRERLHRDYRQLLGDLQALAREERLIRSTRGHGLPVEVFQDEFRRKEFSTKRQKNMDSAFESIYHGIQQTTYSRPPSVAETYDVPHHWQAAVEESPAKLNVAEWQPLSVPTQTSTTLINSINVAAMDAEQVTTKHTSTYSQARVPNLEDLMERIDAQQALLMEEMLVTLPPDTKEDPALQSHRVESSKQPSFVQSSLDKDATDSSAELESRDERTVVEDEGEHQEEKITQPLVEFLERIKEAERDEHVSQAKVLEEEKTERNYLEDEMRHREEEMRHPLVKHRKDRDDIISKENVDMSRRKHDKEEDRDARRDKSENRNVKEREKPVFKAKQQDERIEADVLIEDDSVTMFSEYSFDMSVSKTTEHSIESMTGNSNSTSTSYEGVKIIVNVTELTEKKFHPTKQIEDDSRKGSPRKIRGKKICKRKHKLSDRSPKQRETNVLKDNRNVSEKATMTAENEFVKHDKKEPEVTKKGVMFEKVASAKKGHAGSDKTKWNLAFDKNSSESTSYMSPPDQLCTSHIQDLGRVLSSVQDVQKKEGANKNGIDPRVALYISRLLAMSRESVENLNVSTSDVSTLDVESSSAEDASNVGEQRTVVHGTKKQAPKQEITRKTVSTELGDDSSGDPIETLTHAVKEKTRAMVDKAPSPPSVPASQIGLSASVAPGPSSVKSPQLQPVRLQTEDVQSYSEFRSSDTQKPSTSTPENVSPSWKTHSRDLTEIRDSHEDISDGSSVRHGRLHSSCHCDENECAFTLSTPPFPSIIADMSLEEYKLLKFPEIFSDYSEKCSKRISNLAKVIEQIRGEKRKLMEFTGSSSSSSSSGAEGQGFDSTKYLSPPEQSVVMTRLSNRDKEHKIPTRSVGLTAEAIPSSSRDVDKTGAQEHPERERARETPPAQPSDRRTEQQLSRPHTRPPPCLWHHRLQSAVDTQSVKELSTIIEAESTQLSSSSPPQDSKSTKRHSPPEARSSDESEVWTNDNVPDIMTEMLRRGLITSPLPWTRTVQETEDKTSMSEHSGTANESSSSSHEAERRKRHVERQKFKEVVLESYVGKGVERPKGFRDRKSIADKKLEFSQQVAETFAKLGKNPSRFDVSNAFKNLGLKWKARGQDHCVVNPVISQEDLDPASEEFRQQVFESFVGLGLDSSPKKLEAAFRRLGLVCPGGSLCICDVNESRQNRRSSITPSESSASLANSSDGYDPGTSTSNTMLPTIPSSDSDDSVDLST